MQTGRGQQGHLSQFGFLSKFAKTPHSSGLQGKTHILPIRIQEPFMK